MYVLKFQKNVNEECFNKANLISANRPIGFENFL